MVKPKVYHETTVVSYLVSHLVGGAMNDPLVDEVRKARAEHAERFDYDLKAIFADLRKQQEESGREFVTFPARRVPAASGPEKS